MRLDICAGRNGNGFVNDDGFLKCQRSYRFCDLDGVVVLGALHDFRKSSIGLNLTGDIPRPTGSVVERLLEFIACYVCRTKEGSPTARRMPFAYRCRSDEVADRYGSPV